MGGVYREMLDKGYGAACVVRLSKWTMEHAGDPSAWRAVDTLSFSDFASEAFGGDDAKAAAALREPKGDPLLGGLEDPSAAIAGGHTVGSFLYEARRRTPGPWTPWTRRRRWLDAARLMTDKRQHRAWILDANETPVGVLTCTDVLRCVATAVGRHAGEDRLRRAVRGRTRASTTGAGRSSRKPRDETTSSVAKKKRREAREKKAPREPWRTDTSPRTARAGRRRPRNSKDYCGYCGTESTSLMRFTDTAETASSSSASPASTLAAPTAAHPARRSPSRRIHRPRVRHPGRGRRLLQPPHVTARAPRAPFPARPPPPADAAAPAARTD